MQDVINYDQCSCFAFHKAALPFTRASIMAQKGKGAEKGKKSVLEMSDGLKFFSPLIDVSSRIRNRFPLSAREMRDSGFAAESSFGKYGKTWRMLFVGEGDFLYSWLLVQHILWNSDGKKSKLKELKLNHLYSTEVRKPENTDYYSVFQGYVKDLREATSGCTIQCFGYGSGFI